MDMVDYIISELHFRIIKELLPNICYKEGLLPDGADNHWSWGLCNGANRSDIPVVQEAGIGRRCRGKYSSKLQHS